MNTKALAVTTVTPVVETLLDLGVRTDQQRKQIVVSSRDVARVFEKAHKDVLKRLETLKCSEDFGRRNFAPTSYTDQWNREQPEILLTKNGFLLLVMSYNGVRTFALKEAYIAEFDRMQEQLDRFGGFIIPDNLSDALILAGEQMREVQRLTAVNTALTAENTVLQPKADFYDVAMSADGWVNMNTVAKILNYKNMGPINLFRFLRDNGILMKDSANKNKPLQQYVDKGYFKVVVSTYPIGINREAIQYQTLVSQRGIDAIRRLLNKHGKVPNRSTAALQKVA